MTLFTMLILPVHEWEVFLPSSDIFFKFSLHCSQVFITVGGMRGENLLPAYWFPRLVSHFLNSSAYTVTK